MSKKFWADMSEEERQVWMEENRTFVEELDEAMAEIEPLPDGSTCYDGAASDVGHEE